MLIAAREARIKRLIYTSSSAVYGESRHLPLTEAALPVPATPYGASKLCGEHYCTAFNSVYGLPCTCLRPFNVYGTRENLDEVAQYTLAVLEERPITVYGDGNQTRDFACVKDVARAHILAAQNEDSIGQVLNIGTGLEISINNLVKEVETATGKKAAVQKKPWPQGDIYREFGDISLARKMLGYSPETTLSRGIQELVKNFEVSS